MRLGFHVNLDAPWDARTWLPLRPGEIWGARKGLQLWPVYWDSGAYTGMVTIAQHARLGSIAHQLPEQCQVTTALLDNTLPVPRLIPLQGIPAVIGALERQRFLHQMPEAETKAKRMLDRIEHGQCRQRPQGRRGVWLQDLVVKIVRIEANDQVGNT